MSWFSTCSRCGGPFNGGNCRRCTNVSFGDKFVGNPDPISNNETPDFSYLPPQPQYESYSCEFCGNDFHYGFDCPPRVPLVYEPEPCYNQNFGESYFPNYLCCENCGGPHATFECQPMNQNFHNSNSPGFDNFQPPQYSIIHQYHHDKTIGELLAEERTANPSTQTSEPSQHFNDYEECNLPQSSEEIRIRKQLQMKRMVCKLQQMNIRIRYDDDDDEDTIQMREYYEDNEESAIQLNDFISQLPQSIAITPILPIIASKDTLTMGDKHLSTIPETESSNVENFVPIPSESEDISDSDCDLPFCDSLDISEVTSGIFSNPLFEFNNDYTFGKVNPLFDEMSEADTETITEVVEIASSQSTPLVPPLYSNLSLPSCDDDSILTDEMSFEYPVEPSGEDKNFNPEILVGRKMHMDENFNEMFELETYIIRTFLPFVTYGVTSPYLNSHGSEDTIFDPGIFIYHL